MKDMEEMEKMKERTGEQRTVEKETEETVGGDFEFRYSANEHKKRNSEIERIRNQYLPKEEKKAENQPEDKLERLKKLDEKAKLPALAVSLGVGIGGTLILGWGMSMCLAMDMMVLGILIGVLGMIILGLAYPAHQYLLEKGKEKYREEIVELSRELLESEE